MATNNSRNLRVRVQPYLTALKARETTNREVAELLGCNEQTLSRVLKGVGLKKDPAIDRTAQTKLNAERTKHREALASNLDLSLEEAAKRANVSVRTMYRYRNKK